MVAPTVVLLLSLVIFPTLYLLGLSLSRWDVTDSPSAIFIGFGNFIRLLTDDSEFIAALGRSVFFVAIAVPLEFAFGLGLALLMNRRLPAIRMIRTLLVMPMAMTPIVAGMVWLILLNPNYGLINSLLRIFGIEGPAWTADPTWSLPAIILVDVWQWTPFMFLVLTAGLLALPQDLLEAARVDGASNWQEFRYVVLPLLRRVALLAILIRAIDSWKVFDTIFALTKGGPGTATETLNFYAYVQGFQWFHLGYAAALLVIGVVVASIFSEIFLRAEPDLVAVD
ncbi:MAG TPA: sugar ABC transporter permease [Patescibacteria group bacterium]|nr:sugar ABC transporter permease [Patescibacteria group bacterium]